ncbi:MAG: hypothetical protein J0L92_35030 [Deltaproteobacteria bacterium]|nr:hypothetical protein [Deltaproteobacteria bacterium]
MRTAVISALLVVMASSTGCSCGTTHSPPDAALDGVTSAEPDIDLTGTWHDCGTRLTFAPDGTVTREDLRAGCSSIGDYEIRGRSLEVAWDSADCVGTDRWARELVRADRGFVSVDLVDGRTNRWADDAHTIERFEIVGESGQRSIARLVGTPGDGFGSGCYWSADGTCGGLLSCGGAIGRWSLEGDSLSASTSCSGTCACGARLAGTRDAAGVITGTYTGANCEVVLSGTFVATPSPEP